MKLLNLLLFTTFSVLPSLDATATTTPEDAPTATNFVETVAISIPDLTKGSSGTLPQHTNSLDSEHPTAPEIPTSVQSHSTTKAVIEQMDDWNNLKKTTAYCAILWGWALYSYYSQYLGIAEMWKSKGPRNSAATGYPEVSMSCFAGVSGLTMVTFNLSLNYVKLNWLTPELTISSIICGAFRCHDSLHFYVHLRYSLYYSRGIFNCRRIVD
jgi:hypothetical protein